MILYMESPIPVMMQNLILLDEPTTNGYIYVSKATYDQALLLWGRFEGDVNGLMRFTQNDPADWKDVPWITPAMKWIKENAPEPLNMLAPVFKMMSNLKSINMDDLNPKLIYGLLHIMSQTIDFNATYLAPTGLRTQVKVPVGILMSFEKSWEGLIAPLKENLLKQLVDIADDEEDDEEEHPKRKKVKKKKVSRYVEEDDEEEEDETDDADEDEDESEDEEDDLNSRFANIFADAAKQADEDMKQQSDSNTESNTSYSAPASEPDPDDDSIDKKTDEAAEASAVLNEFDF